MKAILEFNIEDPNEVRMHGMCVKAFEMALILWEIKHNMRNKMESMPTWTDSLDYFFEWFNEEMNDRGINIDTMIY